MAFATPSWLARGYQFNTGLESVTLRVKAGEGAYVDQPVSSVKRRAEDRLHDGRLVATDVAFHLWADNLGGASPKRGDVIADAAGVQWAIHEVQLGSQRQRYRCSCRKI
jgi:hypothetical protein